MSEKDTIENTDKSVDKAENKQSKNSDAQDKPVESKKSDQAKKEDNVQPSKTQPDNDLVNDEPNVDREPAPITSSQMTAEAQYESFMDQFVE